MAAAETASKPQQQFGSLGRWTPSLPTNIMSMLNPFAGDESKDAPNSRKSILSGILPTVNTPEAPSPEKDDESMMFAEPDTNSTSDDASREGSVDMRSKRSNRAKTCYSICHPAPSSSARQKLHRRPRSLLQLHKLSSDARPRPAYEVVPSANFSVRLTKAITKVFKTKHTVCPNDLVVFKAEQYSAHEASEEQEAKDIVALICKGRKEEGGATGKARICLPDGREWEAYSTPQGGYEFFSTDEHGLGLTVRWVPKRNKDGSKVTDPMKRKFNFSTISPNSRRHPVIANLSRTQLVVNDTYRMPDPSAVTPLSTPRQGSTILEDAMEDEQDSKEVCETDERLRNIIVMTGIWVAFKEGWSPNFKYDDKDVLCRSPSLQSSPSKSATFLNGVSTPPASPGLEKRSSYTSLLRTGSLLRKGNRSSAASVPEVDEELVSQSDGAKKSGRSRANSASTVLVHRAASNRAKHHQATWRPDLLDAQREMSEPPSDVDTPSIVRPVLPPANSGSGTQDGAGVATLRSNGRLSATASPEKRESSTTVATTSSANDGMRKPQQAGGSTRRKGRWRRLLCGSQHDE